MVGQLSQWRYLIPYTCCRTGRGPQKRRLPAISGVPLARRSVIGFIRVDEKRPEYRQALKPLDEANTSLFPLPRSRYPSFPTPFQAIQLWTDTTLLSSSSLSLPFLRFAGAEGQVRNRSTAWFSTIEPLQASSPPPLADNDRPSRVEGSEPPRALDYWSSLTPFRGTRRSRVWMVWIACRRWIKLFNDRTFLFSFHVIKLLFNYCESRPIIERKDKRIDY